MDTKHILAVAALTGIAAGSAWSGVDTAARGKSVFAAASMSEEQREQIESSVYYPGCNEARAAGAAPIYAGQPGYRVEMDGDSDGIACEPHPGL